jgi:eukaryotic-like serine/threonine-protein kinase
VATAAGCVAWPAPTAASPSALIWANYQDPSGFSIDLPAGWTVSSESNERVEFTGPSPEGFTVVVQWTKHPKPDALADWRQQAAYKAQTDPTYQQIGIRRVSYRSYNAADWEFDNVFQGELTHVLDRGFVIQPGALGYAIELYGPNAQWPQVYASMWNDLVTSFEPAS